MQRMLNGPATISTCTAKTREVLWSGARTEATSEELDVLTAEQRYTQAIRKARLIVTREMRLMLEGKNDWVHCRADLERKFLIDEIERAYQAGRNEKI